MSQSIKTKRNYISHKIMPEEEQVIVDNSADSIMEETPSEPTEPVTPTEPKETTEPVVPEVELFELPDGRKVDADTLQKEWKENFYPEFTRRSQELAELKKGTLPDNKSTEKPYESPEWTPKSYAELIEIAKQEVREDLTKEQQQEIEREQAIEKEVENQLIEIKKGEPNLNENALFLHANKYGFKDLRLAHQNMKDMSEVVKKVQKNTTDNITKRNDPVSVTPGASGSRPDPNSFSTALDYLRSLK